MFPKLSSTKAWGCMPCPLLCAGTVFPPPRFRFVKPPPWGCVVVKKAGSGVRWLRFEPSPVTL